MSVTPETYQEAKEAMAYLKATGPRLWASLKDASDETTFTFTARGKVYTCGALIATARKGGWKKGATGPRPVNDEATLDYESTLELLRADALRLKEQKDAAYLERNICVAALARMAIELGYKAVRTKTAIEGWSDDWHSCVYIQFPGFQASWHYHDSQAYLFDWLKEEPATWDGHTTEEKYKNLHRFATSLPTQQDCATGIASALPFQPTDEEWPLLKQPHRPFPPEPTEEDQP